MGLDSDHAQGIAHPHMLTMHVQCLYLTVCRRMGREVAKRDPPAERSLPLYAALATSPPANGAILADLWETCHCC